MIATETSPAAVRGRLFSRVVQNVAWLLGSQAVNGIVGLIFLAIVARALGPSQFGVFALALTYGQLLSNLSHFESWKGVIPFGAIHVAERRPDMLARLLGYSFTLDCLSAVIGGGIAAAGAFVIGPVLGWPPELQRMAAAFGAALVLASGGTPTGILRLFDRFDLLAFVETVGPLVRLIGGIVAWAEGAGASAYLLVWALGAGAQLLATWAAAVLARRCRLSLGPAAFRTALKDNPGLWQFMWQTSVSSSLRFVSMQVGTLIVGTVASPAIAGGFRLADRLASAVTKPMEQFARVLFPELAGLVASDDRQTLRWVLIRSVLPSAALSALLVIVALFGGDLILRLFAGPRFTFAQPFLVVLTVATAIEVSGFILEPFHNAHGGAAIVLRARLAGAAAYALVLFTLLPFIGAMGAAIAAVASSAVIVWLLALSAAKLVHG